jgi:type II secretory pathway component PulL
VLSERRVATVRRFLVKNGVDLSRVSWIGMGELADRATAAERAKDRRVTVRLLLPASELGARRVDPTPPPQASAPTPAPPGPPTD